MSKLLARKATISIARQWLALMEKRRAYYAEMESSGRWKLYYTEEQMRAVKNENDKLCENWHALATPSVVKDLLDAA